MGIFLVLVSAALSMLILIVGLDVGRSGYLHGDLETPAAFGEAGSQARSDARTLLTFHQAAVGHLHRNPGKTGQFTEAELGIPESVSGRFDDVIVQSLSGYVVTRLSDPDKAADEDLARELRSLSSSVAIGVADAGRIRPLNVVRQDVGNVGPSDSLPAGYRGMTKAGVINFLPVILPAGYSDGTIVKVTKVWG